MTRIHLSDSSAALRANATLLTLLLLCGCTPQPGAVSQSNAPAPTATPPPATPLTTNSSRVHRSESPTTLAAPSPSSPPETAVSEVPLEDPSSSYEVSIATAEANYRQAQQQCASHSLAQRKDCLEEAEQQRKIRQEALQKERGGAE